MGEITLDDVLSRRGAALLLDAAGPVRVARFAPDGTLTTGAASGEAGAALYEALIEVAGATGTPALLAGVEAFLFCASPGSVLGIRTAALAIRLWTGLRARPAFAYDALELLAAAAGPGTAFVADARRGEWHWRQDDRDAERVPVSQLQTRAAERRVGLASPEGFRAWGETPALARVPYQPAALLSVCRSRPLLRPMSAPDAVLTAPAEYVKWQPQLHRAPRS